jgi:glycerophosphoryl diester phosphodiesterase
MLIRTRCNGEVGNKELALISHRGGKGFGPENTLRSLEAALDFGVEMIETDIRMSADGIPVIHHGPFIGLHLLGRITLSEIRERSPDIPTLRECLELAGGRCSLNLEVKRCDPPALAGVIADCQPLKPILVSSFDTDFLESFKQTGSPVDLGLLSQFDPDGDRLLREARRCGATTLLPVSFIVNKELVKAAHAADMRVITWTVNSTEQIEEVIAEGVDGIITDSYPQLSDFLESEVIDMRCADALESGDNGKGH